MKGARSCSAIPNTVGILKTAFLHTVFLDRKTSKFKITLKGAWIFTNCINEIVQDSFDTTVLKISLKHCTSSTGSNSQTDSGYNLGVLNSLFFKNCSVVLEQPTNTKWQRQILNLYFLFFFFPLFVYQGAEIQVFWRCFVGSQSTGETLEVCSAITVGLGAHDASYPNS